MYCIGLTGTIASGKSTAARFFENQGIEILNADQIAKTLTQPGQPALEKIHKHFGDQIMLENGHLDRRKLRHLIFTDSKERLWLEQLLHPMIRQEIAERVQQSRSSYSVVEIPLLMSREHYPYVNRVLLITTDRATQIYRLMERDHCTKVHALEILNAQPSEENYRALADDIAINDGDIKTFEHQLLKLHRDYLKRYDLDKTSR